MSDRVGMLTLPAEITSPSGDPVLAVIGDFAKTLINANVRLAFDEQRASQGIADESSPVASVFCVNPRKYVFHDEDLPALFIYREKVKTTWNDQKRRVRDTEFRIVWMFPHDPYREIADRLPIANAVMAALDAAIEAGRDARWAYSEDSTPRAHTIAEDAQAIKLPFASSTSPQTYSGAQLDGTIGTSEMNPRREVVLYTSATGSPAYNITSPVVITCVSWSGTTSTRSLQPTSATGGQVLRLGVDVKSVVSIALPAQQSAFGTFSVGTSEVRGVGSDLLTVASLDKLELTEWGPVQVDVEALSENDERLLVRKYDAIQAELAMTESHVVDRTNTDRYQRWDAQPQGIDIDVIGEHFTTSASLP